MKSQGFFLVFILSLTLGLQYSYHVFRDHYSESHDLQREISGLRAKSMKQSLQEALLQNQVEDLQANVYKVLGSQNTLAWKESQWWKSLRRPASVPFEDSKSSLLMNQAREEFRSAQYPVTIAKLKKLIQEYPASGDIIEAHFLLAEALFVSSQVEASLDIIEQMMSRYPESELTGFIMLRMGQAYESRKLFPEARETYQTILREFPRSAELRNQATQLLRRIQ